MQISIYYEWILYIWKIYLFYALILFVLGIKSVAASYSRISLADVAEKLQLDSPEDAEYIIAKVNQSYMHCGVYWSL